MAILHLTLEMLLILCADVQVYSCKMKSQPSTHRYFTILNLKTWGLSNFAFQHC